MFPRLLIVVVLCLSFAEARAQSTPPQKYEPAGLSAPPPQPDLFEVSLGFNYIYLNDQFPETKDLYGFEASAFINAPSWLQAGAATVTTATDINPKIILRIAASSFGLPMRQRRRCEIVSRARNDPMRSFRVASLRNRFVALFADNPIEPISSARVFPLRLCVSPVPLDALRRNRQLGGVRKGRPMLDERRTLTILGWTLGSVCIGTLILSALSLP